MPVGSASVFEAVLSCAAQLKSVVRAPVKTTVFANARCSAFVFDYPLSLLILNRGRRRRCTGFIDCVGVNRLPIVIDIIKEDVVSFNAHTDKAARRFCELCKVVVTNRAHF